MIVKRDQDFIIYKFLSKKANNKSNSLRHRPFPKIKERESTVNLSWNSPIFDLPVLLGTVTKQMFEDLRP